MTPAGAEMVAAVMHAAIQRAIQHAPPGASPRVLAEAMRLEADGALDDPDSHIVRMVLDEDAGTLERVLTQLRKPQEMDRFPLATGRHVWSRKAGAWVPCREVERITEVGWPELVRGLTTPRKVDGGKLQAPWWLPVRMQPERRDRTDGAVEAIWALVADLDSGTPVYACIEAIRATGYRAVVHTTWSHCPDHHKARVVIPLHAPCPAAQWGEVWAAGQHWAKGLGLDVDSKCRNPARLYFLPALPADGWARRRSWFVAEALSGRALDWRRLVVDYAPPPEPKPPSPTHLASVGATLDHMDRDAARRRKCAEGIVTHRARGIVAGGEGGRNQRLFAAGRAVTQLAAVGGLDSGGIAWARATLIEAGITAGLKSKESETAVANGLQRGQGDPPWEF